MFVFDYPNMRIGGIEANFSNLMAYAVGHGIRVVWLTTKADEAMSDYDITKDPKVEKAYVRKTPFGPVCPRIDFEDGDRIAVLTCEPLQFVLSDRYRSCGQASINHFLLLPNTTGNMYYPERFVKLRPLRRACGDWFAKLASSLNQGGCLFGFAKKHLESYEINYGISIADKASKLVPPSVPLSEIDDSVLYERARSRKKRFVIISCARFDFPHKGYLVGLVREFSRIKSKCPTAQLRIVGYGDGEERLMEEVRKLDDDVRDSVVFLGKLSSEELRRAYGESHLSMGVAGALKVGAGEGLPSIIMRQHSYECEGYGLFTKNNKDLIRDCPGDDPVELVLSVARACDSEYVDLAKEALLAVRSARSGRKVDCEFFLRQEESLPKDAFSWRDRLGVRLFYAYTYIKRKLFKAYGY